MLKLLKKIVLNLLGVMFAVSILGSFFIIATIFSMPNNIFSITALIIVVLNTLLFLLLSIVCFEKANKKINTPNKSEIVVLENSTSPDSQEEYNLELNNSKSTILPLDDIFDIQITSSINRAVETPKTMQSIEFDAIKIQDTIRILNDSISILKTSKKIDTVLSRLELAKQQTLFLKQLEQIKKYNGKPTADTYLNLFFSSEDKILIATIQRAYQDMIQKNINLKTETGKKKHRVNFFETLNNYSEDFSDTVLEYIDELRKNEGCDYKVC